MKQNTMIRDAPIFHKLKAMLKHRGNAIRSEQELQELVEKTIMLPDISFMDMQIMIEFQKKMMMDHLVDYYVTAADLMRETGMDYISLEGHCPAVEKASYV